jgi:hypothetical protein
MVKTTVTAVELHEKAIFEMIKQGREGYVRVGGNGRVSREAKENGVKRHRVKESR